MKIACIGWGSLIWNPGNLPIQNEWFNDGPLLPIEFTRQSSNGRMTLIIDKEATPVRTLWTLMTITKLDQAISALMVREGIKKEGLVESVLVSYEEQTKKEDSEVDKIKLTISKWLKAQDLDAAIWTNLSFSNGTGKLRPSKQQVVEYLQTLNYETRKIAEEYIRKAPKQIDTEYRREIEMKLGWAHLST